MSKETKDPQVKVDNLLDTLKSKEEKIKNFSDILNDLTSTEDKKKLLWREIYENSVSDRERAGILFTEAYKTMGNSSVDHASLGSIMSKYLERMSKSNDQILSLADLINKAEEKEAKVDPDDLFGKILE
jgi:argininosuccinate lyase